jgi:glycosyltransferase involved in cell wall biosynthesis
MRVHLYTTFWNEMAMLEFFFRHYEPWVERFVLFDDGSTDGSRAYLRSKPAAEVRTMPYADPDSFEYSKKVVYDRCWKESRGAADWVIVLDVDEFLHHASLEGYLRSCQQQGITCIPALGIDMVTETFPDAGENLARSRTQGAPNQAYCKLGIFNPDAIESIDFSVGSHSASMTGRVVLPERDELLLLHYKKLGLDYYVARSAAIDARRKNGDREKGWGHHFAWPRGRLESNLVKLRRNCIDVTDRNLELWQNYPAPRWWRPLADQPPRPPTSGWTRFWNQQGNSIRKRLGPLT